MEKKIPRWTPKNSKIFKNRSELAFQAYSAAIGCWIHTALPSKRHITSKKRAKSLPNPAPNPPKTPPKPSPRPRTFTTKSLSFHSHPRIFTCSLAFPPSIFRLQVACAPAYFQLVCFHAHVLMLMRLVELVSQGFNLHTHPHSFTPFGGSGVKIRGCVCRGWRNTRSY